MQCSSTTNYAVEFPTFREIAGVKHQNAMEEPHPENTSFVVTVSLLLGKYSVKSLKPA